MQLYGLTGYPLGHSFSAAFFNDKFRKEGVDALYRNFELADITALKALVDSEPSLRGVNVTIPHKQAVIHLLDEIDPTAKAIGAVNTVKVCRTATGSIRLTGFNTDAPAFARTLAPLLPLEPIAALVLGTGGASKAVCHALASLGVPYTIVSRHKTEGISTYNELTDRVIAGHRLIVNTTPAGMFPDTGRAPDIPYSALTPGHICYDLIYNPQETEFMRRSALQGARVKNGLDMLHLQALLAWEIWQRPCC